MSEPRLYLYRKAGRAVWDAEMWLPDARRITWRTGLTERKQAEQAARRRLEEVIGTPTLPSLLPAVEAPPTVVPGTGQHEKSPAIEVTFPEAQLGLPTEARGHRSWLQRLDALFFAAPNVVADT